MSDYTEHVRCGKCGNHFHKTWAGDCYCPACDLSLRAYYGVKKPGPDIQDQLDDLVENIILINQQVSNLKEHLEHIEQLIINHK